MILDILISERTHPCGHSLLPAHRVGGDCSTTSTRTGNEREDSSPSEFSSPSFTASTISTNTSSSTTSLLPPRSTSSTRGSDRDSSSWNRRSRTRMTEDSSASTSAAATVTTPTTNTCSSVIMERKNNFYTSTFILVSWALVILILSPSASANRCTPTFTLLSNGGEEDYFGLISKHGNGNDSSGLEEDLKLPSSFSNRFQPRSRVTVREGSSFKLNCSLNMFHLVKWTLNGREITPRLQDEWDVEVDIGREMDGPLYTELRVNNASQKFHNGEYKCTPQCMSNEPGANLGVTVSINIAINVTIADSIAGLDQSVGVIYRKFVAREKSVELKCKAPVPNAQMTWYRIKDDRGTEENMAEVCVGHDLELAHRMKTPPAHCAISIGGGNEDSSISLKINRARKEGNETLKTISDFRKYICRAKEGNQDGQAVVSLLEMVSVDRKFLKGERSVSVTEGNELDIYCDVHGVDKREFDEHRVQLVWTKDGQPLQKDEKNTKPISEFGPPERGKPVRMGFHYGMADPEHRGQYTCEVVRPSFDVETINSTKVSFSYYVRVKDKLGALWPFLGICGEVVILCTIILIYEKRRNKTELDESDTDGSPDQ